MGKKGCELYPKINGEASKLYKDLLAYTKDRELTNYIYALYSATSVASNMDNAGFSRNTQGEHEFNDVKTFLDVATFKLDASSVNTNKEAKALGAIDINGLKIEYSDAKSALDKVKQFNETHSTMVATVLPKGDKFVIMVDAKNAGNYLWKDKVDAKVRIWDVTKQTFDALGIDLTDATFFDQSIMNAYRGTDIYDWFHNITRTDNKYLNEKSIRAILKINENDPSIQRLITMFGGFDNAVTSIYDSYRNASNYTAGQHLLIDNTMDIMKHFPTIDMNVWEQQISNIENDYVGNDSDLIKDALEELNKKYHINKTEYHRINNEIRTLSDSAAEELVIIQRQIDAIIRKEGVTPEVTRMQSTLEALARSLKNKRYYLSTIKFLDEASTQLTGIDQALETALNYTGTTAERNKELASALMQLHNYQEGYIHILKALIQADELYSEDTISNDEYNTIKDKAKELLDYFNKNEKKIQDIRNQVACDMFTEVLGTELWNGVTIPDLVMMSNTDSSWYDYFYSMARVSNPLISSVGGILDNTRSIRDRKIASYSQRIEAANRKLMASGVKDTNFMYEKDGHIVSDIDWESYYRDRAIAIETMKSRGLYGIDLKFAIQTWEENHSEDRVVDYTTGRTEKVPNSAYRKSLPTNWTPAMAEYYNTMMAIKGELGSLLPQYAQRHYSPPQVRKGFWKSLGDSFKSEGTKGILKRLKRHILEIASIKEDDTAYNDNGVILDGGEFSIAVGDIDNSKFRQIPIFFINKLKHQEDLTHDFSTALGNFMATACNYEAINNVKSQIDFLSDFIINKPGMEGDGDKAYTEMVEDNYIRVFKDLFSKSKSAKTVDLLRGFMDTQVYGNHNRSKSKWYIAMNNIISYTSIKNLALNVKGWIANAVGGVYQNIIEAGGGEYFNFKDLGWAIQKMVGDTGKEGYSDVTSYLMGQYDNHTSKASLLVQMFDPTQENYDKALHYKYNTHLFSKLLSGDFTFLGYSAGEQLIHMMNTYAILNHKKLTKNGKTINLYDALIRKQNSDGTWYLEFDPDATYKDADGNDISLDDAFIEQVKKEIKYVNQTCHGAMNSEDKGNIHRYILGRAIMNMRQWMVEHYSRRFRRMHYDATVGEYREGFYRSAYRFLRQLIKDAAHFDMQVKTHWNEMNDMQKSNVKRALTELAVIASLLGTGYLIGEPDDHKREFWMRMWIYQNKRMMTEIWGSTPVGAIYEFNTLANSPMAATNTINSLLYPVLDWDDAFETIKTGPHAGENRYLRNIKKYTIPFYNHIEQIQNMDEDDGIFAIFNKNSMQK